jgi:hypothetical protein
MTTLAAKTLNLGQGHTRNAQSLEALFHVIEFERLQYCYDQLHERSPLLVRSINIMVQVSLISTAN